MRFEIFTTEMRARKSVRAKKKSSLKFLVVNKVSVCVWGLVIRTVRSKEVAVG